MPRSRLRSTMSSQVAGVDGCDLLCSSGHHRTRHFASTPVILPTVRAEVFPAEAPELRRRWVRAFAFRVPFALAAEDMPAAAFTGIRCFGDPGELGADGLEGGVTDGHA